MSLNEFVNQREFDWKRLQLLMDRHQGRDRLTADEVREVGSLYRAAISDLALARRDYPDQRVTAYLNTLATRAHGFIYQRESGNWWGFLRYFTHTLPQTFRATSGFTLSAFLLFLIPSVIGFTLAYRDPDIAVPLGLEAQRQYLADSDIWTEIPVEERPYMSAFIMQNNIRIALLAFGGGVLFGLFTVWVMAYNGLVIGATLGLAYHYGMGAALTEFIVAHGVIELSVIFISGGAGLQLAWAVLQPGRLSRRDALGVAAQRALVLALAAVPLLIIAGLIEGFISPSEEAPFIVHIGVAVLTGIVMYGYLLLAGRKTDDDRSSTRTEVAG
jgi:uncharacterized membrane protein SpoIIM required for sporulation